MVLGNPCTNLVISTRCSETYEEELRQNIVRSLGSLTVTLFAVFDDHGKDRLELAGSGSLVCVDDGYYVLTAAHVWEEVLKSAVKMGITLTDNINHQHLMDVATIVPTMFKPDGSGWNEWGPDLALLRIPLEHVGGIKAFHVFEDLKYPPKPLNVECLECFIVMGTPKELGTFTQSHAEVQIIGRFVDPKSHEHGEYDYFDFQMDTTALGMPRSSGGLSGGGLWRVLELFAQTGKIDWAQRLKGAAFFEFPLENGYRVIRCHGPKSIATLAGLVTG